MKYFYIFLSVLIVFQINGILSTLTNNRPEVESVLNDQNYKESRDKKDQNLKKFLSDLAMLDQQINHLEQLPEKFTEKFYSKKIPRSLSDADDLLEMEFCSECFLSQINTNECLYCHLKYLYKTSKRTKPSSKYWYTRAGK